MLHRFFSVLLKIDQLEKVLSLQHWIWLHNHIFYLNFSFETVIKKP